MINMFAGGAIERMAIFALNIMPYISASIIMQLMQSVVPTLEALKKEGEQGRKQLNQYTRYLTVVLAAFQAFGIAYGLEGQRAAAGPVVLDPGIFFRLTTVATLVGGTMFLMWLGEQITARGVGNGTSLIIMAGIVAGPAGGDRRHARAFAPGRAGVAAADRADGADAGGGRGHRVHRARTAAAAGAVSQAPDGQSHVPGRCLASAAQAQRLGRHPADLRLLAAAAADHGRELRAERAGVAEQRSWRRWDAGSRFILPSYVALIVFFAFFYTSIVLNPQETADNLRKYGGFLPGIRPGAKTAEYIDYVLTRITVVGAIYLSAVCVLPELLTSYAAGTLYFGGTSLLIAVSVTMDTVAQIQSHLLAHQYEGLIKKAKLRGATRRI